MSPLPHRGRAWLLGVAVPAGLTLAAALLVLAWVPRLPDPLVVHWGREGPDATGSLAGLLAPFAVYGGISLLVCALFAVLTGRSALVRRMTAGIATGMAALNAGLVLAVVRVQLDVPSPAEVGDPGGGILLACLLAVAAGGLAAALAGRDPERPSTTPVPADAQRAAVPDGEETIWRQHARPRSQAWAWAGIAVLVLLALTLGAASGSWWLGAVLLLPAPLLVLFRSWRVQVDASGLSVVADLGWPRQHVPATEVERADVVEVDPFGQFGGWGLRIAPDTHGTVGVVLRKGEAIAVRRSGGRRFVVTVDDAATGAALLNTYAARSHEHHPAGTD